MSYRFPRYIGVVLALCLLLLSSRYGLAQNFTPTPAMPPSANYQPFNGSPAAAYYLSPTMGMPTYMTSINYPGVYGSYIYPRPPGFYQPGLQRSQYTTSPTLYSVYAAPASAFGPGANVLNTAMTPLQTTAFVNVWVPMDAELRFQGMRTDQRGMLRRFTTPPLIPGREYQYDVDATWTENGRPVTRTRHVPIRAGDRLYVDFRMPEATEPATSTLRTRPLP